MRTQADLLVEAKVFLDAPDEHPIVPERKDGISTGVLLAVDIVEAQFTFDGTGMPFIVSARVRGLRVKRAGEELIHDGLKTHWMDLDIALVPPPLRDSIGLLRSTARGKWKEIREAK